MEKNTTGNENRGECTRDALGVAGSVTGDRHDAGLGVAREVLTVPAGWSLAADGRERTAVIIVSVHGGEGKTKTAEALVAAARAIGWAPRLIEYEMPADGGRASFGFADMNEGGIFAAARAGSDAAALWDAMGDGAAVVDTGACPLEGVLAALESEEGRARVIGAGRRVVVAMVVSGIAWSPEPAEAVIARLRAVSVATGGLVDVVAVLNHIAWNIDEDRPSVAAVVADEGMTGKVMVLPMLRSDINYAIERRRQSIARVIGLAPGALATVLGCAEREAQRIQAVARAWAVEAMAGLGGVGLLPVTVAASGGGGE